MKILSSPLSTSAEKESWCYYPHQLWDSVSPVCRIFFGDFFLFRITTFYEALVYFCYRYANFKTFWQSVYSENHVAIFNFYKTVKHLKNLKKSIKKSSKSKKLHKTWLKRLWLVYFSFLRQKNIWSCHGFFFMRWYGITPQGPQIINKMQIY